MSKIKTQNIKNKFVNYILLAACVALVVVFTVFYIADSVKNSKTQAAMAVADEYFNGEHYEEAIEQYKKVIAIDAKKQPAYAGISNSYLALSDLATADGDIKLAVGYASKAEQITELGNQVCDTTKFKNQLPIVFKSLNTGFIQTIKLFAITLAGALPLGLLISFGTRSRVKIVAGFFKFLIWIVRGTPLMLQLILIYYGPGTLGNNIWGSKETGRFWAAAVAFVINYSCYFSEIFRGGIQAIPIGQDEAGLVLGMSKSQIFFKVKLIQMVKRIVPPMSNEILTLVKDTSLARIIAFKEIIFAGYSFMKGSQGISGVVWPIFFTGVYYLVCNGLLTIAFGKLEKKLEFFK